MSVKARLTDAGRWVAKHPFVLLRRVLYVIIGIFVAYLLIVNIALQTRVIRGQLVLPPTEVTLEYTRAYSVFPGRFHVENLKLRGQDSQIEWILKIDRADYWLSFRDLARRVYHASGVRADGVEFRVRLRVEAATHPTAEHFAALPPIEGFADPPMKDPGPPSPTDLSKIWSVRLDDVDALHVRETWVDAMRQVGDMHIRGRWYFVPTQFIDVGPISLDVSTLKVGYGADRAVASDIEGRIDVALSPMDIREAAGREFLQHLTGTVDVKGTAHYIEALRIFVLPKGTTGSGSAPMSMALVFDHGRLAPGTQIELSRSPSRLDFQSMSFKGDPRIVIDVKRAPSGADTGTVHFDTAAPRFAYGDTTAKAASAAASVVSHKLDFCDLPFSRASIDVSMNDVNVNHHDLDARLGSLSVKSNALALDYDALTAHGDVDIQGKAIRAPLGKEALHGSLTAKVRARADKGETQLTGSSIAFDGAMAPKNAPWWIRVELGPSSVRATLPHALAMQATVRAQNATPATALIAPISGVPRWLLDAAPFDDLIGRGELRLAPGVAELRSVSAKGGAEALRFEYAEREKQTEWLLMADAGPLRVGIHSSRIGTDIRLLDVESWFDKIANNMRVTSPLNAPHKNR